MKLSFKRDKKETGLAAIANPHPQVRIKGDKKVVGIIYPPSRFGKNQHCWKVSLAVKRVPTPGEPSPFSWISFKFEGKTEDEARAFVTKYWDGFVGKYDLYALYE